MTRKGIAAIFITSILLDLSMSSLGGVYGHALASSGRSDPHTVTVVDSIGRRVEVPARVERIACLYAFSGHVVTMLGRGNDITAVSKGLQRDVLLNSICPRIGEAVVPRAQGAVNIEELILARPDVVFVQQDIGRNRAEVEKMNAFHLPFLVVEYHTVEGQQGTIAMIGKAIGAAERADTYIDYYRRQVARIQSIVRKIPHNQRVRLYHATVEATRTYGTNSLPADWMRLVGVINVALEQPLATYEGDQYASLEQIFLWNPDVILVNEPGVADHILHDRQWATLRAVKQSKVYQMPIGISRWGHPGSLETPLAMIWTAKTVYPVQFATMDMRQETEAFYKTFFQIDLTDELYAQIISGQGMRKPKSR